MNIVIEDVTPPEVFRLDSSVGRDEDENYYIGSVVYFEVIEDNSETGCVGTICIYSEVDDYDLWEDLVEEGDGRYSYYWETSDLEPGQYEIEVTLTDPYGNQDEDGADEDLDLLVNLRYESTQPGILSIYPSI